MMGARFVAIFIVFVSVFSAIDSEGKGELGQNSRDGGFQVEQILDYCRKKLRYISEGVNIYRRVVDFGLSVERITQKAIADLPPFYEKQWIIQDEFENLFSRWVDIPRRYLRVNRGKRQLLEIAAATPQLEDTNYSIPVDFDYPSPKPIDINNPLAAMRKFATTPQDSSNDSVMYLIGAVIASSMAGIALAALVLFFCVNKDRKEDEPKDVQRDENPLLDVSSNSTVESSPVKSDTLISTPSRINFKSSSTIGASFKASLGTFQAASPEIVANDEAFRKIPLPLPPARAAAARAAGKTAGAAVPNPGTAIATMAAPTAGIATPAAMEVASGAGVEAVAVGLVPEATKPKPEPAPEPKAEPVAEKATVAAPPPPPPPKSGPAAPPPPPRPGQRPPPPLPSKPSPLGPHHRRTSTGGESIASDDSGAPKAKLKPFFWDKVMASPDQQMVWHELKAGSFQFDEDMMEALFGYSADQKKQKKREPSSSEATPQFIKIIDPKKAQNLAILLKALSLTSEEVCAAITEGNELPAEFIQNLLKMAPTADEELKLRLYTGDLSLIGPAERFLKALIEIPFAFKRLEALLFVSTFQEEFSSVKQSLATLEVACEELKNSRLFLKLLEAVLKTGNRMNDGTYRGGAQAFKLDTLLKLSDVKGTDGKTSLLHFVVHEIIRGEGIRAARRMREGRSVSSVMTEDLSEDSSHDTEEYYRSLGLQEVAGLSSGLRHVKKAALIDHDIICDAVSKLGQARFKTKAFLETEMKDLGEESKFLEILSAFINQCESDSLWLIEEEKRVTQLVKSTGDYFQGRSGKDEGSHLFVLVRDFLVMVDKACQDVKSSIKMPPKVQRKDPLSSSSPSPSQEQPTESTNEMQSRLFPAMRARQVDDEPHSDDDT